MENITALAHGGDRPVRIAQFGEGNFLRAFVDYMIDVANEKNVFDGSVTIVKPIVRGDLERFHRQNNLYTVVLRGRAAGRTVEETRIVTSISSVVSPYDDPEILKKLGESETIDFIVSNTTEAGIALTGDEQMSDQPPASYPGKLTQLLYARYLHFNGEKGVTILPVELIDRNGDHLRQCVFALADRWNLGEGFKAWLNEKCMFCCTLVDRIVTGYPAAEADALCAKLGYRDELVDVGEPFGLWVIESKNPDALKEMLPLDRAGLPVIFTRDLTPYRERKVRILNGAHTSSVLAAYLAGEDIVRSMMLNPLTRSYVEKAVYRELLPTVPLPEAEVRAFAESVMERFENPFIDHALLSISLNSVSKWRARVLPGLKDSLRMNGRLPDCLTFSLAALIAFYTPTGRKDGLLTAARGGDTYLINDDEPVLNFFWENRDRTYTEEFVRRLAARTDFWGEDLNEIEGLTARVAEWLNVIGAEGMKAAIAQAAEG